MPPSKWFIFLAPWLIAAAAVAAPPLPAAVQAELDAAVLDYDAGHFDQARQAFESLVKHEVPAAQYNLAVMHLRGEVPQPDLPLAQDLLTRAARSGFVTAQLALAKALENGDLGSRDLDLAHCWYGVAATGGSVDAQVAMGTGYYLGRGLPKDPARAVLWFREAANGGDVGAMYLLASMYEKGDGVGRDLRLARHWYEMAARHGDEAAPGKVRELDALLSEPPA
ncbi:MAG TPA: tetratricopeptide repeat protein [Rubrivivax sp.]|nr:tetratricopeptide repeat protein [Rubrivivax sp.]